MECPSFCHDGDDRITFNLHGKGFFRLIFHCGAKPKKHDAKGRLITDSTGLLEWQADDRALIKFTDMADVRAKEAGLCAVVKQWLSATDGGR